MNEAFVRGEEYTPRGEQVTEYPEEFQKWVRENADKIHEAQGRGTEPYFVRNNAEAVEGIINAKAMPFTIAEKDNVFTPAATIEEAQIFAQQFVEKHMRSDKVFAGLADYKNIDLDIANEINRTLQQVFDDTDVPPISGIKTISPKSVQGKKAFKDGVDAIAAYDPVLRDIYLNRDILGSIDKFNAYIAKSNEAFEYVMGNRLKLTGLQREIAERYQLAGRSLVDDSIRGCINHELGHHIQWTMPTDMQKTIKAQMQRFAPTSSGYAGSTWGEYIAESFAAYMKDETRNIDPALMRYFDGIIKSKGASLKGSRSNLKMATSGHQIAGVSDITVKEQNHLSNNIRAISKKANLFGNLKEIQFSDNLEDGVLMSWRDGTLTISKVKFELSNGAIFCPADELKRALSKLMKGEALTFNEEYAIEALYHENVHSKATLIFPKTKGKFTLKKGAVDEVIAEACTQLYARENYRNLLKKYGVEAVNYDAIKYNGYGYKETCNLLREYFTKDGKIQVGELINIANETTSGSAILKKKLRAAGWSEPKIDDLFDTLRKCI